RSLLALDNLVAAIDTVLAAPGRLRRPFLVADPAALTIPEMITALRRGLNRSPGLIPVPPSLLDMALRAAGRAEIYQPRAGSAGRRGSARRMGSQRARAAECALAGNGISTSGKLGLLPPPLAGEGWGGGECAHTNLYAGRIDLVACPLPIPPPQAGEGTHRV